MRKPWTVIFLISGIGFILNLIWENTQAPLYQGYESFFQHLPICAKATFGDVVMILLLYITLTFWYKDWEWLKKSDLKKLSLVMILGFSLAVVTERWSLNSGRWGYTESMPVIPFLNVGVLPILQMILLPVITFYFVHRNIKKYAAG